MSSARPASVARLWDVPAFIIDPRGTETFTTLQQLEQFFADVAMREKNRGINELRADVEAQEWLEKDLVRAQVRWLVFDVNGEALAHVDSTCLLRIDAQGLPRLSMAKVTPASKH